MLGLSGSVLALVSLAFVVQSWIGGVTQLAGAARATVRGASRLRTRLGAMPTFRTVLALVVGIAVPLAQVAILATVYVVANVISILARPSRHDQLDQLNSDLRHAFDPGLLRVDWISGGYLAAMAVAIGWSYWYARRPRYDGELYSAVAIYGGGVLGGPAWLVLVVFLLGAVLYLIVQLLEGLVNLVFGNGFGLTWSDVLVGLEVGGAVVLACVFYGLACILAIAGSRLVIVAWRERATD